MESKTIYVSFVACLEKIAASLNLNAPIYTPVCSLMKKCYVTIPSKSGPDSYIFYGDAFETYNQSCENAAKKGVLFLVRTKNVLVHDVNSEMVARLRECRKLYRLKCTELVCAAKKVPQQNSVAQSETTLRVSFQFFVTDGEGSVRVIAFGKEAEKVLAATTEDLHRQKNNDDQAELDATLSAVENKNMLLQIVPSSALTTSYVLKWVVRAVEAAAVVKKEPDDLKIEDKTSQAEGISPNEGNFLQAEHEE